jgi:DNA-binding PadR family transcriptional regulator
MSDEIDELKVQNLTKLYTLVLLKSKKMVTGYFILKKLSDELGKTSSPTYVYDFLKNLEKEGYIKRDKNKASKRSKGYSLTASGDAFIDRIFSRFENLIDVAIQSKLKICASCGVKLYTDYHIETIDGKELNFCCVHCAAAFKTGHSEDHTH